MIGPVRESHSGAVPSRKRTDIQKHGVAELSPPSLLLDGGARGSVSKASESLRLAQPTISGQVKTLEDTLGEKLFERRGRKLVLTEMGHVVFHYADEIWGRRPGGHPPRGPPPRPPRSRPRPPRSGPGAPHAKARGVLFYTRRPAWGGFSFRGLSHKNCVRFAFLFYAPHLARSGAASNHHGFEPLCFLDAPIRKQNPGHLSALELEALKQRGNNRIVLVGPSSYEQRTREEFLLHPVVHVRTQATKKPDSNRNAETDDNA